MIVNSWSISVRHMWQLPYNTHRFFIEPLGGCHAKTMIYCRFVKFIQSILKTDKKAVIYLLFKVIDDQRTITGKNANLILKETNETNIFDININKMKRSMKFMEQPEDSNWKINLIKELTDIKMNQLRVDFEDETELKQSEIDDIIEFVATS